MTAHFVQIPRVLERMPSSFWGSMPRFWAKNVDGVKFEHKRKGVIRWRDIGGFSKGDLGIFHLSIPNVFFEFTCISR